ncbi:putative kinesin [Leptomonas pyrrhocoris]|uniref:Kinesin-like protein n=1 Tax=Leptomonas pyrrhocoris TaxID=157538 RepID=A0A0M9G9M0_LEPPY|nr:putative kinesin [Leptomonas pyrrhocoris]XP_015664092.1 putative kinesin [Leptomonas pyrrhocoris]KPA85652.1 putative kinesin [Leptomonas pyrrhocoris]KPA85653.1 putative kinesin [Leptomonas pyrrhocoris]|eukprot:XP_015664091.1 putative kinesin [Leptomonas pyrrhocoris]
MTSSPTASSIEVAIRVRPLRAELHESRPAWQIDATSLTELAQPDNAFTFDRVYDTGSSTAEIYKNNVRDTIVARVAQGYNGTIFAYGQTGSGKSFTMFGDTSARSPGLIRLAVHDLFKALAMEQQRKPYMHAEVFVSVLEIYNEQLRDLLQGDGGGVRASGSPNMAAASPLVASPPPLPLSIRENEHGVYVHNARRVQVASEEECANVIYTRAASRVSAATMMNEHSSRSHCVIRLLVERSYYLEDAVSDADNAEEEEEEDDETTTQTDGDDEDGGGSRASLSQAAQGEGKHGLSADAAKKRESAKNKKKFISTLNMVDLAGSERVAKTGATGLRMIEGGHINKSLTTLTTVINRLASESTGQQQHTASGAMPPGRAGASSNSNNNGGTAFIPYRDSRLTHLLKTSLGGNSFTAVLCCITPAVESANESRSTLQFASRAKRVKNKAHVNEVANAQTRVRELEAALRNTKKLLVAQTLYLWSKQLRIRRYEEQLASAAVADSGGGIGLFAQPSAAHLMNQQQQQQMIIAQLNAQNDALREEAGTLRVQLEKAMADGGQKGSMPSSASESAAAVAELASLRRSLQYTQDMLKERETAVQAAQASLDELDGLCRELEGENKSQAEQIKALTRRTNEADELITAVEEEHNSLQHEIGLLRAQLQQSQARLLEKHRGDDYLAELTKLHVEHQNLLYSYSQLKEKADRDKAELMQRLHRLTEKNNSLEDDVDEAKDETQLRNSFLWRLLSAAAQVTQGKPLTIKDPSAAVRDAQVAEAVRALTSFAVLSARTNPHNTASASSGGSGGDVSNENVWQLQGRIRGLEEQLIAKDAQRDVIIDAKLKRIQGLVLRLHAVNVALVEEMRHCFHDNEQLFDIAMRSSKTQKKVEKAGLTQRSFESALDRARFTQPPHKPLYHN